MSAVTARRLVRRRVSARKLASHSLVYAFLIVIAVLTLLPLVYAFFASFKSLQELLTNGARLLPQHWDFQNYAEAWNASHFSQYFLNSVIVVVGIVVLDTIASSMLGYVLARRIAPALRYYQGIMAATLFIGVGTATLYPRYLIAQHLGITNLFGVILVELSGLSVVHTFLVRAFCESLPLQVEEAARLDGCRLFGLYRRITFPLLRPILATTAILAFQAGWNNFQIPLVFTLARPDLRTLVIGVYQLRETAEAGGGGFNQYNLMLAGAMLILLPVIGVFIALQRYFIRGLTEGSVSG